MTGADAGALIRAGRYAEAAAALRAVTSRQPGDWASWLNLGHVLRTLGEIDAAAAAYRHVAAVVPTSGAAWWGLANLKVVPFADSEVEAMTAALARAGAADRIGLHFALFAALDARGDHPAAFAQLRKGNALRLARVPHDAARTSTGFRRAETVLTPERCARRPGEGERGPIFIVGLPRSGSTLVEQMLASHPAVEAMGELHELHAAARPLATEAGYLDGLASATPAQLTEVGRRYLEAVARRRSTTRPLFTDKMPSNWIYAGVIPLILPGARIVDVRREGVACGFANYAQHYAGGNDWTYDLAAIGAFTNDYVRLMAHVHAVLPGAIHRVGYEALVGDPEGELRRLLAYLDLPYDPACLRFHDAVRAVGTPSSAQVRRPIARDRDERWRSYARWLRPLEAALTPSP